MAAGNFPRCLAITLSYEGGKADNPADPGGRTNKGITQATYDAWRRARDLATADVFAITDADVAAIYSCDYWTAAGCEALASGLDLSHFDASVNSGARNAAKWLAKARTKTAIADQIRAYADGRLGFLEALKTWRTFGRGWATRVAGVEAKALAMASGPSGVLVAAQVHAKAATSANIATRAAGTVSAAAGVATIATTHPATSAAVLIAGLAVSAFTAFGGWVHDLRASALGQAIEGGA